VENHQKDGLICLINVCDVYFVLPQTNFPEKLMEAKWFLMLPGVSGKSPKKS
jgi:hypothetical protein